MTDKSIEHSNEQITVYTELFTQPSNLNFNDNSQIIACSERPIINNNNSSQLTEIFNLLQKVNERQNSLHSKLDRLTTEMISIRIEVSTIKTKIYGDIVSCVEHVVPRQPLLSMKQYDDFETQLEFEETFKEFVKELCLSGEKSFDKFIRNCWRRIFSDQLAEHFSWRGTSSKKCIRGSRITLAIRNSFKNKFALNDEDFDKISQKHFQYAHDRLVKFSKYKSQKIDHEYNKLLPEKI